MQKAQFSFLNTLKRDLKKYENVARQSTISIDAELDKLPEKDREIFVNLQNKINDSVKTGSIKGAMEAREELMNYLKEQNGTSHSGNQS
jgi:hypothetical protein